MVTFRQDRSDFEGVFNALKLLCYAIPVSSQGFGLISHPLITSSLMMRLPIMAKRNKLKQEDFPSKQEFDRADLMLLRDAQFMITSETKQEDIDAFLKEHLDFIYESCIKQENDFHRIRKMFYIFLHKPYQIELIDLAKESFTKKDYTEFISDSWTDVEFPHQAGVRRLVRMFKDADAELLRTQCENDKKGYDALPETIIIYRGLQGKKAKCRGLSWTTNLEKAKWFANRFKFNGKVYQAEISKKDVFFYTDERGEAEVVVNPAKLKKIQVIANG